MSTPLFPVLDPSNIPQAQPRLPEQNALAEPKKWCFSFRYWRQIEYFGLDRSESKWFSSLLERLRFLCEEEIEKFITDSTKTDSWRYHNINWGQKNIPVKIGDLEWLPAYCKTNQEEFPLLQFQVSQSLGRVVGFWDRDRIFCVVLLDPYHNIQPTKATGYRVDPCSPLRCDYSSLLLALEQTLEMHCKHESCNSIDVLKGLPTVKDELKRNNVLFIPLTTEEIEYCNGIIEEGRARNFIEIFQKGLEILYQ